MCAARKYPSALPFRPHELGLGGELPRRESLSASPPVSPLSSPYGISYRSMTYGIPVEAATPSSNTALAGSSQSLRCKDRGRDPGSPHAHRAAKKGRGSGANMPDALLLHPTFAQFNPADDEEANRRTLLPAWEEQAAPASSPHRRRASTRTARTSYSLYDFLTVPVVGEVAALAGDRVRYRGNPSHRWIFAEVDDEAHGDGADEREAAAAGGRGARGMQEGHGPPLSGVASRSALARLSDSTGRAGPPVERNYILEQMRQDHPPRPRRIVVAEPRQDRSFASASPEREGTGSGSSPFRFLKVLASWRSDERGQSRRKAKNETQPLETFRHDALCACGGFRQVPVAGERGVSSADEFALVPFCIVRARAALQQQQMQQQQLRQQQMRQQQPQHRSFPADSVGVFSTTDVPTDESGRVIGCVCRCHQDSWFQTRQCTRCDCFRRDCDPQ